MSQNAPAGEKRPFLSTVPGLLMACTTSCLLWGSAFPCVKIGYRLFGIPATDTATILLFAGLRFFLAGVMVLVAVSLVRRRPLVPRRRDLGPIATLALFQTILQYVFFYLGLSRASGVTSSIIEAANVFLCVLVAALLFRSERLTARKLVGCAVGFAGVVLVNLGGDDGGLGFSMAGEGLVLLSTVSAAFSICFNQRFSADHDPVLLSGWQFALGGAVLAAMGLAMGGHLAPADAADPLPAFALLAYLGLVSALGYTLWSLALAHNPVSRVSVFGFMNPVFGVLLSALLLGETNVVSPALAVAALVLVSVGIVVVNRQPSVSEAPARP